jgi:DNA-binding response OmpR family regulator
MLYKYLYLEKREEFKELKKKIFIVDDDIILHEAITAYLSSDEFEIIHAYDGGHDILERIENEQPDLIILDIMMPIGDGRDICRDVKKNPKTKNIKILMLSAKSEHYERILGLELGADEYITKPIDQSLLPNRIKRMCGMRMKTSRNDK